MSTSVALSWSAGSGATSHDVYFGTDSSPDSGELQGNQTGTTFNPGTLANSTTYYWRIDEKNSAGTTTGTVWSFTTSSGSTGTDITNSGGTISARYTDSPSGEDITKLIDNTSSTKYFTFHSSGWVRFHANNGAVVVKYTITSANDAPERDPKNWTLQGSNNGSIWTTLNTQTNQSFASRFLKKTYTFSNSTSYTYYRLNVTAVQSGSILQMSEWELWTGSLPKGVAENNNEQQALPEVFVLEQNYPNPFNPTTTLRYQLPEAGEVTLKVYDVLGREVASLFNGYSPAGYYTKVWSAGHLSSGVYFCRLRMIQTDGRLLTQTKSMLLLK